MFANKKYIPAKIRCRKTRPPISDFSGKAQTKSAWWAINFSFVYAAGAALISAHFFRVPPSFFPADVIFPAGHKSPVKYATDAATRDAAF